MKKQYGKGDIYKARRVIDFPMKRQHHCSLVPSHPMAEISPDDFPLHKADQCVMCGLCLPYCPTYKLYNTENESPRGRIALMRAVATDELPLTPQLEDHLDHCLVCRACEDICPADVPYGELIDAARTVINRESTLQYLHTPPESILNNLSRLEHWRPLLSFYQHSGLQKAARALQLPKMLGLQQMEQMIPVLPVQHKWHNDYPAAEPHRGRVALFTGCTGKILDGNALAATIKVLTRLGYSVTIPPKQGCCGILHQHSGYPSEAGKLALNNLNSFQTEQLDAIISISTGCGTQLSEYKNLSGLNQQQQEQARLFSSKTHDINQFLTTVTWPTDIRLEPLDKTVAVHIPCSQQYMLHQQNTTRSLLEKIPKLAIIPLPDNQYCCGAGGDYMLRHPDIADSLVKPKLDTLEQLNPDIIVSANIGCALHFNAALQKRGVAIEVIHPITLLARQMNNQR